MGSLSIWHWLIVALVIMLLFGKGRISEMMGDLGKGITSFKKGLSEDETSPDGERKALSDTKPEPVATQPTAVNPANSETPRS